MSGFQEYAMEFSELSDKHNERSIEIIDDLLANYKETAGRVATIRCTSFGVSVQAPFCKSNKVV
jgi:hypothetical protein